MSIGKLESYRDSKLIAYGKFTFCAEGCYYFDASKSFEAWWLLSALLVKRLKDEKGGGGLRRPICVYICGEVIIAGCLN